jgi:FtsP/CotA-like multicopper oxidase with cupredoxin domain
MGVPWAVVRQTALRALAVVGTLVVLALLGVIGWAWWNSRLPDTYNVMDYGAHDLGGGAVPAGHQGHHAGSASVADLRGPQAGTPDARFALTAQQATIRLPSGREVDALTFDGRSPGPELRVRQDDLVEVTLANEDVGGGVSIHWHGVNVPNAEDGVAGVTQDAVLPGGRHTYRFRAKQVGTFWYHTHQSSAEEVRRGLFGPLVIEPRLDPPPSLDLVALAHDFEGTQTLNGNDGLARRKVAAGTPVRLRLINSDNTPQRFTLAGTPFRVVAIDGTDLNEPQPLENTRLVLAGGGRYDIAFIMPPAAVELAIEDTDAALALSPDGRADLPPPGDGTDFNPSAYGRPAPTPFGASSRFDRTFTFEIGRKPGFLNGRPGMHWTINGGIYPDVPVFVVERGDLVKVTIENDTDSVHPMHLHGHHALVLSRNGSTVSGSPWWTDTLDVEPEGRYEIAFRADNPGLWMDHCHNLPHAAQGLTMHIAYAGVSTPYRVGGAVHNHPE